MKIGKISPLLYKFRANEKNTQPSAQPPKSPSLDIKNQGDTSKKTIIPIVVSASITAILIGGALFRHKSAKPPISDKAMGFDELYNSAKIYEEESQTIVQKSKEILSNALKKFNEYLECMREIEKANFEDIVTESKKIEFQKTPNDAEGLFGCIKEFNLKNGWCKETKIRKDCIDISEVDPSGIVNSYWFEYCPKSKTMKLTEYIQAMKTENDGTIIQKQLYKFEDGKVQSLAENVVCEPISGETSCDKLHIFDSNSCQREMYTNCSSQNEGYYRTFDKRYLWGKNKNLEEISIKGSTAPNRETALELYEYDNNGELLEKYTDSVITGFPRKHFYSVKYELNNDGLLFVADRNPEK